MQVGGQSAVGNSAETRATRAIAVPLVVFAARRRSFDMLLRAMTGSTGALAIAFSELPLEENGWNLSTTNITRMGSRHGWPVWRLTRGMQ